MWLNRKGMTLIEVVVAIGLFGIIMVTIFPAFLMMNLMNIVSSEIIDATYVAQRHVEFLYEYSQESTLDTIIAEFSSAQHDFSVVENNANNAILNGEYNDFSIEIIIVKNTPSNGLHSATINVESLIDRPYFVEKRAQVQTIIGARDD